MQDVATAHSAANGWPMERYLDIGSAWVVRSHFIEYLRPAFPGDVIEIFTWASSLAPREVSRSYLFRCADDLRILARAETKWVYVDLKTGRPKRVPEDLMASFEAVLADDPELTALRQSELGDTAMVFLDHIFDRSAWRKQFFWSLSISTITSSAGRTVSNTASAANKT